jgi:uncharacterized Ntn-hydrolase superfamily protein
MHIRPVVKEGVVTRMIRTCTFAAGLLLVTLFCFLASAAVGGMPEGDGNASRPVHTYSIVARDPETGDLGVAVQSHWFSVGPIVPWARAGVGAVATQSLVLVSYGPLGLALMEEGANAGFALAKLVAEDSHSYFRQVAMVDAEGDVAAHTGDSCIAYASHHVGSGYSVQANMMLTDTVVPAMAEAYEAAKGDLADRMLTALAAAQAAGGDIRGMQSAAILIVRGVPTGESWSDVIMELRVEDHPRPLEELSRLVALHRAYELSNRGDGAMAEGDLEAANEAYGKAADLAPGNLELRFWRGVSLLNMGRARDAVAVLESVFEEDPNWKELLLRLPASGLVRMDREEIVELLSSP